jgi:hypothetical protein
LSLRHPVFKLQGEAVQRSFPVPYWHRPFLADIVQPGAREFSGGFIGRKGTAGLGDFPQAQIN